MTRVPGKVSRRRRKRGLCFSCSLFLPLDFSSTFSLSPDSHYPFDCRLLFQFLYFEGIEFSSCPSLLVSSWKDSSPLIKNDSQRMKRRGEEAENSEKNQRTGLIAVNERFSSLSKEINKPMSISFTRGFPMKSSVSRKQKSKEIFMSLPNLSPSTTTS